MWCIQKAGTVVFTCFLRHFSECSGVVLLSSAIYNVCEGACLNVLVNIFGNSLKWETSQLALTRNLFLHWKTTDDEVMMKSEYW